jgi:DNA polymerase-3 subunit gamma/tau
MAYLSLYRKYRSQSFEELAGQDHVTRTLQNAIRAEKVAHAYLFCGPRGTGKTSSARLLAKALNCETGPSPEPCNHCQACQEITAGTYLDLHEIDAASNRSIDDVRDLRDNVAYAPVQARYKVYVIDEAHQLTNDAFNALLKTLEEPPAHVVFILATTEAFKIPATIISRCQKFEFRRASVELLRERVAYVAKQEGAKVDAAALDLIARSANGGWRDALSVLEQVLAYTEGKITARDVYAVLGTVEADTLLKLGDHVLAADGSEVFGLLETLVAEGKDPRQLIGDLTEHYRGLMLTAAGRPPAGEPERVAALTEQARRFGQTRLIEAIEVLAQTEREARWSEQPRLLLELAAFRLMHPRGSLPAAVPVEQAAVQARPVVERPQSSVARPVTPPASSGIPARQEVREPARVDLPENPATATAFGAAELPPPPLTVGDARTGADGSDEDLAGLFGDAPPEGEPMPPPERPTSRSTTPARPTGTPSTSSAPVTATSVAATALPSEAAAPSAAANLSTSLPVIQGKWRLIQEELRRMKKAEVGAILADTMPKYFEEDVLVIQFSFGALAERFTGKGKAFADPLTLAISRLTGITCRVRAESQGSVSAGGSKPGLATTTDSRQSLRTVDSVKSKNPIVSPSKNAPPSSSETIPLTLSSTASASTTPTGELIHDVLEVFEGTVVEDHDLA